MKSENEALSPIGLYLKCLSVVNDSCTLQERDVSGSYIMGLREIVQSFIARFNSPGVILNKHLGWEAFSV